MSKQTIGEFLAIQRKAKGMTQQEVADILGISNRTLSSWESGRSYPDILILPALAEIYGVTVDEILNGERTSSDNKVCEISEKSQKKLLNNAVKRYSVKCTTLVGIGIGGVGLFVLALLLGIFVAGWLFVLFAVLSILTELTVIILFVVFEKSALIIEEQKSRYSLIIKNMTYRAVFKIVCAMCIPVVCAVIAVQLSLKGSISVGLIVVLMVVITSLLLITAFLILFVWLSGRGKEFYTEEEMASHTRNKKLAIKIFSVGAAIAVVLFATTFGLSTVSFTHTQNILDLPKAEFIRAVQTIEININDADDYGIKVDNGDEFGNYFVDIQAALSNPIERVFSEKRGYAYHIEGNLYLRYNLNYEVNDLCYISYIPNVSEAFEITFYYGHILYRDKEKFEQDHPDLSAEDLLSGIRNEEVFFIFVLDNSFKGNSVITNWGVRKYVSEPYIKVSEDRYILSQKSTQNYPFIIIGIFGILVDICVCICLYVKKHSTIDIK